MLMQMQLALNKSSDNGETAINISFTWDNFEDNQTCPIK